MDPFARVPVGTTGLRISQLGFGSAAIGDPQVSEADAEATVRAAWDAGVRTFDTAPMYGNGRAEFRLGRALASYPRDEYVLSTKVGRLVQGHEDGGGIGTDWVYDLSDDGIRRSVAASLRRLGADRIDVLLIHDPDDHPDAALNEAYPVLADLRAQGVVSAIGFGMTQVPLPVRFARETDMDVLLLAGRYTLLDTTAAEELLPLCAERGVSVLNAQSLHGGLIEGQRDPRFHYQPVDPATQAKVETIREICDRYGVPTAAPAIQFPLAHPAVVSVLTGPSSAGQLIGNIAWAEMEIARDLWTDLKREGILTEDLPVPTLPPGKGS